MKMYQYMKFLKNPLTGEEWSETGNRVNFQSRDIPERKKVNNTHLDTE